MKKNIWIVGCSSGIGLELVKCYLHNGQSVIASARTATASNALLELQRQYSQTLALVDVDVSNSDSVKAAVQKSWSIFASIDIVIFNAGVYESMDAAHWDVAHFEAMANTNYLGAVRLMDAALAHLRAQNKARIVFNASLSSYFGLPYGGAYSAPKAALVNFAQSIQPEMEQENIEIQIINHGFVQTRLTAKNEFAMPELMTPAFAAQKIVDGIAKPYHFEIKFPFKLSLFLTFLAILPYKISLGLTKKFLKA